MTTTYTVAANELEGVIIRFQQHPNPAFSFLHHTLNSVYGVDFYKTDFYFLFHDITTNQQTELYTDAPQRLLDYMIDHIKYKLGASTRGNTAQVQVLFENMLLSYKMKNNKVMQFKRGQDLASGMVHFIANQQEDVPAKCMEVLLLISTIYPSPTGIVDGLNMDKLFNSEQTIPPPSQATANAAVTAGTYLAAIANTMSTAVSGAGLTSKAAAHHADADQDETIDFEDMPTNLRVQYALKKHQVDIFRKSDLVKYNNVLTTDKHGTIQDWHMIEYPEIGNGNTTAHDGQTYLCMIDGSIFGHLDYQNNRHKSTFLAGAPGMTKYTPKRFYDMCIIMEMAGAINRVWIHSFLCRRRKCKGKWGFVCADQNDDADADLPMKYQPKVDGWGVQIMVYLRKVLPKEATSLLDLCRTDGHQALQQVQPNSFSIPNRSM